MRTISISFQGDNWNDEKEAEEIEEAVQQALDAAGVSYLDVVID